MSLRRRIATTAIIGLTVTAVLAQGAALGVPTATPLGPEGGDVWQIVVRPHLVLAVVGESYYPPLDRSTVVWASTDEARTWHRATKSERAAISPSTSIEGGISDVRRPKVRYRIRAARSGGMRVQIVSRSVDAGQTWITRSTLVQKDSSVSALVALATRRRTTLLAGLSSPYGRAQQATPAVLRSTDGGLTWRPATGIGGSIFGLWGDPGRANVVFATTGRYSNDSERVFLQLWRSRDAGLTWVQVGKGLPPADIFGFDLALFKTRPGLLVMSTSSGIFRSKTAGNAWQRVASGPVTSVQVHPNAPGVAYAATPSGVLRSADFGRSWNPVNHGMLSATTMAVAVNPTSGRLFVGGEFFRSGLMTSTDNGRTWATANIPNGWYVDDIVASPTDDGTAVIGGFRHAVKKTTDGGQTWASVLPIQSSLMTHDVMTGDILAVGTGDVLWNSVDMGDHWTRRSLVPVNTEMGDVALTASGGVIIAAPNAFSDGLWRSEDHGQTWGPLPVRAEYTSDVVVAPSDPQILFGVFQPTSNSGEVVSRSSDGGATWQVKWQARPHRIDFIRALTVDRTNPDRLYANMSSGGVWVSSTGGATWSRLTTKPRNVFKIVQHPSQPGVLFVTTFDDGLWRIDVNGPVT